MEITFEAIAMVNFSMVETNCSLIVFVSGKKLFIWRVVYLIILSFSMRIKVLKQRLGSPQLTFQVHMLQNFQNRN